jgi:SAM-dependent methyltransferase
MSVSSSFNPNLFHHFYFNRSGLYKSIKKYSPSLNGILLDFGCGEKPYRSLFNVDKYIGVEAEYYKEKHQDKVKQIDAFWDGKSLPFKDEYFDSILCTEVIEHVFNLPHILEELNRVLKKDGVILITCPFVWNEHGLPYDYARYTRFALQDLLEKRGFTIQHFEKSGNFITTLTQSWVLYFQMVFGPKVFKVRPIRWFYKVVFCFIPNLVGMSLSAILPNEDSIYLNNIVLAKKVA